MSYFEENIKIIKRRDIVLYEQLQLQQEHLIDRVEASPAKDGDSYLKVRLHGQWVAFNSTYHPAKEAEAFAKKYESIPPYGRVLFLGFGNGCFCRELINVSKKDYGELEEGARVKFAFYEPDSQIFLYAMQMYDLSDILGNEDVFIFVEGLNDNLLSGWCNRNLDILNEKAFLLGVLPKYAEHYADAYARICSLHDRAVETLRLYANSKKELGTQSAKNGIYNLIREQKSDRFSSFVEHYPENLPFVIVSSGPSLEKSLGLLQALAGRAFIMAADSAAAYLIGHGIKPDGIMCRDPIKLPALFTSDMREIPFFVHTEFNHEVLDLVRPKHIYFVSSYLDYERMMAERRGDEIPELDTGGSVATLAFALAAYLHVEHVILIGQDLCVTPKISHVTSVIDRAAMEQAYIEVPGNLEATVYTYSDFYSFLEWFQDTIQKHKELRVINGTAGGARIEGAVYMSSEEVCAYVEGVGAENDYNRFMEFIHKNIEDGVSEDTGLYDGIQMRLTDVKSWLAQGLGILKKESDRKHMGMADSMKNIVEQLGGIQQVLAGIPEFELLEHACVEFEDEYIIALADADTEGEKAVQNILMIYKQYYTSLLNQVDVVALWCAEAKRDR